MFILLALLALMGAGCGGGEEASEGGSSSEGTSSEEGSGAAEKAEEKPADPYLLFVRSLNEKLQGQLTHRASQDTFKTELEKRLKDAVAFSQLSPRKRPENSPVELTYDQTLLDYYTQREFNPVFTTLGGGLTPAAEVVMQNLDADELHSHGLVPEDYHSAELVAIAERANINAKRLSQQVGLELFPREQEGLAAFLEVQGFDLTAANATELALETILAEGEENPLPRLRRAFDFYQEQQLRLTVAAVEAEVKLADGYARYARDFRLANLNVLTDEEIAKYGERIHPKDEVPLILERIGQELDRFAALEDTEAAVAHVEALWPRHPQYQRLREAYARYEKIVAEGGWPNVPEGPLNKGGRAPRVSTLKRRLMAEGLYTGPMDDFFDENLSNAIKLYQTTHQFPATGTVEELSFWRSLNIDAERRTAQIRVNLDRFRMSRFVPRDYYVYVNIPDFHAEVWKDGQRQMRFRVVVGNNDLKCDPRKQEKYLVNATPLMHSKLEYLVFNPYWNVPERIRVEEVEPIIAKDPTFMERHNYEYHTTRDGSRILRQKPGPDNALGLVKFIFPNRHNTYMHDTPKKGFFDYSERAFSHGCVRVQNPMDFARFILQHEGKWDEGIINEYLYKDGQTEIYLDKPIDVFVEYYTTQVDDNGHVHFLSDVYRYVRHQVRPPSHAELSCMPESVKVAADADLGP